jgi:hypothetical protein
MAFSTTDCKPPFGTSNTPKVVFGYPLQNVFASGRKRFDTIPGQVDKMPSSFFNTNIFCTMNALYSMLFNTLSTPKAAIIGFVVSGVFSAPFLSAQVIEPASAAPVAQEQGAVQVVSDMVPDKIGLGSGSPTPANPGSGVVLQEPFIDAWSHLINDKTTSSTAETFCDCPGNLIANPGYESGTTSWSWWNGSFQAGTYAAQCGTNSGQFQHSGSGGNGGAYQDITGVAIGAPLTVNVYAGVHNTAFNAFVAVEFYKSDWTFISDSKQAVNTVLPSMSYYTINVTVPANTHYVRFVGYCNGDWIKMDGWCATVPETCNASITGLIFNEMNGGADITIVNGGTYNEYQVSGNYNLEAVVTAGSQSAEFTVTGPTSGSNTENAEPYNHPSSGTAWTPAPGSYTVTVKIYSQDNLGGVLCDEYTISFTILGCNNVTNGGTIGSNQVACGVSSYNPAAFTNITFPTGGSGTLEYMWLKAAGPNCPAVGDPAWTQIAGADQATYDAPAITSSMCYMRCSRRAGCENWDGESNVVSVVFNPGINLTETHVDILCNGASTGSIDLSVSGGTSPYTYNWGGGVTTQDRTGLAAGTYTVTVTDSKGCTATKSVTIDQPPVLTLTSTKVNVTCNGGNNGSIDLTVTGGTTPYTYNWGGGITTQDRSGLTAGTYTVTVTDGNACTKTLATTVTQPSAMAFTASPKPPACYGGNDGDIYIDITTGATPNYSYNWTRTGGGSGSGSSITTEPFYIPNLTAGTYAITITNGNGCTATASAVVVNQPSDLNLTTSVTNILCAGQTTGAIDLTVSGGTPGYTYNWGGGITTQDRSGLAAGTYTVTVTDASGCTKTTSAVISQPGSLSLSVTKVDVACFGGSTGSINLTVSGGTSPYTYNWGGGITTEDRSNLAAGSYTVTVSDVNACTKTISATITQPASGMTVTETNVDVLCAGNSTGSIDVTVSGGTSPYTYNWGGGITTQDRSGLAAGTYTLTVTDANSCTKTVSATITEPAALSLSTTQVNVLCNGAASGSIDLTVTGGTSPYTYDWSNDGPENPDNDPQDLSNLLIGTYTVTVTDANSCTKTISATITLQPAVLILTTSPVNVLCKGASTGSVDLTVVGGVSPYTYIWTNSATTQDLSNLAAGTYTVTVSDANSCTKTASVTITEPSTALSVTETNVDVLCFGASTGSIDVSVSGGTSPYTYNWGGGITTQDRSGLAAGTYTVTVTDANACTKTVSATITQPSALTVSETNVDVLCFGANTGSIDVTVSGGTSPYTYNWGGGITTQDRTGLAAGTYTVTVTDANSCTKTVSATITQPATGLTVTETNVDLLCNGANTARRRIV